MSKYEESLKNLSYDVHRLCKEMGWEMDSTDIEVIKELIKENNELKSQLELTEKALELACLSLRGKCDYCKYKDDEICPPDHHCSNLVVEYFLKQAEEMMKSE